MKSSTVPKYYPLNGGLDVVTPALSIDPGFALAMANFEPYFNGGYRRVDGYERFDGHAKPSAAVAYGAIVLTTGTGLPPIGTGTSSGNTGTGYGGTGVTSGATAQFVESIVAGTSTWVAMTNVAGTFSSGEVFTVGTATATFVGAPSVNYAPSGTGTSGYAYSSEFLAQCQNYYRQQIKAVPGVGNPLGIWQNGTNIYAIRGTNTAGGTGTSTLAAKLWLSSGTGWAVEGTYCSTIYYGTLNTQVFAGTANITTNGVMYVTAVATGSVTVGMTISDQTGYIPQSSATSPTLNAVQGAQVIAQIGGVGVGGTGTYQLSF